MTKILSISVAVAMLASLPAMAQQTPPVQSWSSFTIRNGQVYSSDGSGSGWSFGPQGVTNWDQSGGYSITPNGYSQWDGPVGIEVAPDGSPEIFLPPVPTIGGD